MLAMAGAGAVLGFFAARHGASAMLPMPGPKALKLLVVAGVPLVWLVVAGFHELGHLVGGWLTGGRFLLFMVGPLKIQRTPTGVRWGINRSVNLSGGMAACVPADIRNATPGRTLAMIAGGPVASLVLAPLAWGLAMWLTDRPGPVTVGQAISQHLALVTAVLSLLIFLVTALPAETGGFKTDGRRILDLLRGGPVSRQERAVFLLSLESLAGRRPAELDPHLLEDALSLGDGSLFDLYAQLVAYTHAADRGDWARAQGHLDTLIAGEARLVPYVRDVARCEYAWLLATNGSDAAVARAWLETSGKLDFDPATRLRAEAAVLLAEGNKSAAQVRARQGLEALEKRSLSPVINPFAQAALQRILAVA